MSETNRVTIPVILEMDDISIQVGGPRRQVVPGRQVEWAFEARRNGQPTAFPKGWAPMVFFEGPDGGLSHGPCASITQVLDVDGQGHETLKVAGRVAGGDGGEYHYYAVLYKGAVEGEEDGDYRESLLLSSARNMIVTEGGPDGEEETDPGTAEGTVHGLTVVQREDHLQVEPSYTPIIHVGDSVQWKFEAQEEGSFPLIFFYKYKKKELTASAVNASFGPFCRLRCLPDRVIGERVRPIKGVCGYEAALVNARTLVLKVVSSGDPQLDNEGNPTK